MNRDTAGPGQQHLSKVPHPQEQETGSERVIIGSHSQASRHCGPAIRINLQVSGTDCRVQKQTHVCLCPVDLDKGAKTIQWGNWLFNKWC